MKLHVQKAFPFFPFTVRTLLLEQIVSHTYPRSALTQSERPSFLFFSGISFLFFLLIPFLGYLSTLYASFSFCFLYALVFSLFQTFPYMCLVEEYPTPYYLYIFSAVTIYFLQMLLTRFCICSLLFFPHTINSLLQSLSTPRVHLSRSISIYNVVRQQITRDK